jgi:hypothetical protein
MYAVGHFALGYLTGRLTSKSLGVNVNLPLLFLASVFPDIDILIPGLVHRGPLHSVLLFCLVFLPIFAIYKKRAAPYFVAVIQHIIIGDYLIGGDLQLLWPLTSNLYGFHIGIASLTNIVLEWSLFLISLTFMIKTKDIFFFFKPHPSNMILAIPVLTVLLPTVISFPMYVPLALLIPHIVYLLLFTIPIIIDFKIVFTKTEKSIAGLW